MSIAKHYTPRPLGGGARGWGFFLLLFLCLTVKAQISVTPEQVPLILTPSDTLNVGWKEQTLVLPIQTNLSDVEVSTPAEWVDAAMQRGKLVATVRMNESAAIRLGKLTLLCGETSVDVIVKQQASHLENEVMAASDFDIFADPLCTRLRADVTLDEINRQENLFVRTIARRIYEGTYDYAYRTHSFECLPDPAELAKQWLTGKSYDVLQGVTGIMVRPGRFVVAVEGVPESGDFSAKLNLYAWTVPEGQGQKSQGFLLKNGLNILESTLPYNGLAYISYYSKTPEQFPPIKVHFLGGIQNGYLASDLSNDSCYTLCEQAPYTTIDLVGEKVHAVWETKALLQYTKGKYRQLMNTTDTIVSWIQRLTGMEKYKLVERNKTMIYVNYSYFMHQTALGASFKYDTQDRALNPTTLLRSDHDYIWGYSHEWGHQHQLTPYLCWGGLAEVINNMNSCYNVLHFGYTSNRILTELGRIRSWFLTSNKTGYSTLRHYAYQDRNKFQWNKKMYDMYTSMSDSAFYSRSVNPERAIATTEAGNEAHTIFWGLHEYITRNVYADYTPDLYQAMRETDTRDEKYAILAAAQNEVAGKWNEFKTKFPTSCWVKDGYVNASSKRWDNSVPYILNFIRQSSLIAGINLFDVYDQLGFLRTIAFRNDDYGLKYYCMTPEMKAEFRADMQALEDDGTLRPAPEGAVKVILSDSNISSYPWIEIPN